MKTYIATIESNKNNFLRTVKVYRIKKNKPFLIGDRKYSSQSTKGDISEAFRVLMENKEISNKEYNKASGYYYQSTAKIDIRIL